MKNDLPMKKKYDIFDTMDLNDYECCNNNNCPCDNNNDYDLANFINQNSNNMNIREKVNCNCQKPNKPICKSNQNSCCCKDALKRSFKLLLDPYIKSLIDLTTFTLIAPNYVTTENATTIKSVSTCDNDSIFYNDDTDLTLTTLCDLVGFNFTLNTAPVGCLTNNSEINNAFIKAISKAIPTINTEHLCCKKEEGCCCNNSKASYLANSVSPVSIFINSSALTTNPVSNLQVISVTDSIAWFFDTETRRVYVICLNNIVALN